MSVANTLIHNFLEQSAEQYPDKIALIHEDVRVNYADINASANRLAHWLIKDGIRIGDRVALIFENSLEYVVGYYGILKTGAVAVPLSTDLKPDGLGRLVSELEPRGIITSSRFERLVQATDISGVDIQSLIIKDFKLDWHSASFPVFGWREVVTGGDSSNPDISINDGSLASIIYTSGSTGAPKGVMLSHGNIVSNTHSICQYLCLTDQDIQMTVLPFFYVMGKSLLNTHFAVGGTIVINNKFAFPATVIKQMVEEHVTGFSGVPSTYAYLLHRSPLEKYRDQLTSLRYCSQAGGHMSKKIKEELRCALPAHTKIFIMYGATEASARLTYLEPDHFTEKIESIGKPITGVTLKILDENGREVPGGQTGELVGNGPNIMQGYWRDQDATASVLDRHGYHTGDQGYKDEDGCFYVTGRKDKLLKVGGHRINPQEIEDTLMESDLVMETAVMGVADALLGHRLIALVAPKNGNCSENMILGRCAERMPKYKMPSEVKLVRTLPKNTTGKIDMFKCMELAEKNV
ncbi:AMP-dependent synthetase and ligase [uncultured Desulfobacterium sp.]|uniref:AMP-dependent synthetase and ligase n=1 Tax=uncultured Desulfobacterium sp. TaxID=201089 RepID=A0A445MZW2_9BACT|nr:AMP-dependent synthetase and ligase [uncultured Desulfobacterium sp.]